MSTELVFDTPRLVFIRPQTDLSRYMVFMPDAAGMNEIGFVTRRDGAWEAQRPDRSTLPVAYVRRRDAAEALVAERERKKLAGGERTTQ